MAESLVNFLHVDMDKRYRDNDPHTCHGAILRRWNEIDLSDQLFTSDQFFCQIRDSEGKEDCFFSINSFYKPHRSTKSVRHLNGFVLDYDFYKIPKYAEFSAAQMYSVIKATLPVEPSFVVDSGRGLYIIFAIEHCSKHMVEVYRHVYTALLKNQLQFGADPKATLVTQVIRIPGTINSRSGRPVTVLEATDNRYSLSDLADRLLPYDRFQAAEYRMKFKGRTAKKKNSRKSSTTPMAKDFEKLISLRNQKGIFDGYRELLIYLYWESLMWMNLPDQIIEKKILKMNSLFQYPLPDATALKQCRPARKYEFRTSISKIVGKLSITADEQKKMTVLCCRTEKRRKTAKASRRSVGKTKKQSQIFERRTKIIEMLPVKKIRDIADTLRISVKTVIRDLKYIASHLALFQKQIQAIWKRQLNTAAAFASEILNLNQDLTWNGLPEDCLFELEFFRVRRAGQNL